MEVLIVLASIVLAGTLAGLGLLVLLSWLAARLNDNHQGD